MMLNRTPLKLNVPSRTPLRLAESVTASRGPGLLRAPTAPRPTPRQPKTRPTQSPSGIHPSLANYDPNRHHIAVTLGPAQSSAF